MHLFYHFPVKCTTKSMVMLNSCQPRKVSNPLFYPVFTILSVIYAWSFALFLLVKQPAMDEGLKPKAARIKMWRRDSQEELHELETLIFFHRLANHHVWRTNLESMKPCSHIENFLTSLRLGQLALDIVISPWFNRSIKYLMKGLN